MTRAPAALPHSLLSAWKQLTLVAGAWLMVWNAVAGMPAGLSANAFDQANHLYEQGKYAEAIGAYQAILESAQASAALYFNLGNAYFKSGQIGRAIHAYEMAEQIAPRDPDLRANLRFARDQVRGPTLTRPAWQRWLARLSLNEWTIVASATLWLFFALLSLRQLRPSMKAALRVYTLGLGAAACGLCACLALAVRETRLSNRAIVVVPETPVRQAPLNESQVAFTVRDGAELRVLDHKGDWLQVASDPQNTGWLPSDQLLVPGGSP